MVISNNTKLKNKSLKFREGGGGNLKYKKKCY